MLVKKFMADNYAEALDCVKREMGEDALVVSTRSIKYKPQEDGAAPSSCVEITAALEREPAAAPTPLAHAEGFEKQARWQTSPEWDRLQPLLHTLLSQTDRARSAGLKPEQVDLFGGLLRAGVEERFAVRLFEMVNSGRFSSGDPGRSAGREELVHLMKRMLNCGGPLAVGSRRPKVAVLVGPTGVGKTTTIAKLAAHFALGQNLRVALISLDSFRMGAVEQLRAYGDLMELPVETAQGRLDFRKHVHKHRDKDLILVDTTGKSRQDLDYVRELKTVFQSVGGVETHLVQSATTQDAVLHETFARFAPLNPDRVLITKLDEGLGFGPLFNCAVRHRLPFSYFTTGQNVPEDIEVAVKDRVIRLIFG